jgi:hypothetical protein
MLVVLIVLASLFIFVIFGYKSSNNENNKEIQKEFLSLNESLINDKEIERFNSLFSDIETRKKVERYFYLKNLLDK